jgi:uncharacterized protein (TIGR03437 family)
LDAPRETVDFVRDAKRRVARQGFAVGPGIRGDQVLIGVSVSTPPGEYTVHFSAYNDAGEERAGSATVVVDAIQTVPVTATKPPVILLNGWQFSLSGCPVSKDSTGTFGSFARLLQQDGVPVVYFFDNCVEDPSGKIEDLGNKLAQFLNTIKYDSGAQVPQIDLVAHSMGGLIARAYLAGLQADRSLAPPVNPLVRKFVQIATPNFGSFLATSILGEQAAEMIPASSFLWGLATWNQWGDDLRGVDALAIIGNAGICCSLTSQLLHASDGLVSLTSASLGFARDPSRTRIVPYCHTDSFFLLGCSGPAIANADEAPKTAQILRSFLADSADWASATISTTPPEDSFLSQYGGLYFVEEKATPEYVVDVSQVSFGSMPLQVGGATGFYFSEFIKGTGTFQATSASLGILSCGPFTVPLGYYYPLRCKASPVISGVTPLLPNTTAKLVQPGTNITIAGLGFGQLCTNCKVLANPGSVALQVSSWSDQAIAVFLPAALTGLVQLVVQNAAGSDATNIMAAAVAVTSVTNAASSVGGAVAPGEIVAIKGGNLGPSPGVSFTVDQMTGNVDSTLAGTRVFFDGFAAPILYASATQVNAIVPYEVAGQAQTVMEVEVQGVRSAAVTLQLAKAAPASFTSNATGSGQASAVNGDGSLNGPSSPAAKGTYVFLYFTGGGLTEPPGVTGSVNGSVLKYLTQDVSVTVGGQAATVTFAGAAPTFVDGVGQLNILLGDNTPSGPAQPIVIKVGGVSSPATATLAIGSL